MSLSFSTTLLLLFLTTIISISIFLYLLYIEIPRVTRTLYETRKKMWQRRRTREECVEDGVEEHENKDTDEDENTGATASTSESTALLSRHTRQISPADNAVSSASSSEDSSFIEPVFETTIETIDIESINENRSIWMSKRGCAECITLVTKPPASNAASSKSRAKSSTTNTPLRPLFLLIPGNPGLVGFYKLFLLHLSHLTHDAYEFRAVSYCGHVHSPHSANKKNETYSFEYNLEWMRRYIVKLMRQYPGRKIYLAGHSVGAYVCIEMMEEVRRQIEKEEEEEKLQSAAQQNQDQHHPSTSSLTLIPQSFLLFPTLFSIALTPNGRTHTPVLHYFRPVIVTLASALSMIIPSAIRTYLLYKHLGPLAPYEIESARSLFQTSTIRNCLNMADGEMKLIGPVRKEMMERHVERLYTIFGHTDRWAPLSQLEELKSTFGASFQYEMSEPEVAHAFVVNGAWSVAKQVARRLKVLEMEGRERKRME